jgi:D-aminopeptidase
MTSLDNLALRRRVQRLLSPWNRTNGPGVTLGVVLGHELAIHESAGMASIELGVPIGPETTFRIASVSKQFTCAAILLLAGEGRLALDDDVRRYIPALPDLGHRITLAHLMHNTAGIRDMLEIMRLGGMDLGQSCRPEDLLDGVCRQRGLNFAPGSRYLYSNSNFMLLGRVVEQVSGEKFGDLLDRRLFAPIGMNATRHVERTTEVVAGLATGYLPRDGGWIRALHNYPLHGEGGLVSSVADLALWHAYLGSPRGEALADGLSTMAPFNNSHPNTYARGQRIKHYRGVRTVGHDGLWPGFKTSFVRIPECDAAVICICNDGRADPHDLAFRVVDALIEDRPGVQAVPPMPPQETLQGYAGRWLDRDSGTTVDITVEGDCVVASTYGVSFATVATEDGRLATSRGSADFTMRMLSDDTLEVERDAGVRETLHRVQPGAALPADLAGRYLNADCAAQWTIEDGALRIVGPLTVAGPWELEAVEGDCFRIYTPMTLFRAWLDCRVQRDSGGRIAGIRVDGSRARGLMFTRV